jgi:DNA-binding IclR family transcriptional regulator
MPGLGERRLSVLLFGNRYKLDLLAALAEAGDGGVSVSALAERHQVSASVYYPPLKDLLEAGLVAQLAVVSRERRRWYARVDHQVWEPMRDLARELAEMEVREA